MPAPSFDKSTGWWIIRYRDSENKRIKKPLAKQPNWKVGQRPPRTPPADIVALARPYQDKAADARHGIEVNTDRVIDLREHLTAYQSVLSAKGATGTIRVFKVALRHFMEYCQDKDIRTLKSVTPKVLREYLAHRTHKGASYNTIKKDRGILSPAWANAVKDGLIRSNPWKSEKVPGKPRQENPVFWELKELSRLSEASSPTIRDIITIGSNTGIRISALLALAWKDVLWDEGKLGVVVIRAAMSKSSKTYSVPISEACRDVLQRRYATSKGELVFPSPRGEGITRRPFSTFQAMKKAAKQAGLPDKGHYNHILRHTFATHAIRSGVPITTVQKWLGHSSITQTMVYVHTTEEESHNRMAGFSLAPKTPLATPPPSSADPDQQT